MIAALLVTTSVGMLGAAQAPPNDPAIVRSEFIYENARRSPQCHASTIVETPGGLVAAWFGGDARAASATSASGSSRHDGERDGRRRSRSPTACSRTASTLPCWNPVLFQPRDGPLMLFYKVGPVAQRRGGAWSMTSADDGRTWSTPRRLPGRHPRPDQEQAGAAGRRRRSLCPVQHRGTTAGASTSSASTDGGTTWAATPPLNDGKHDSAPSSRALLMHPDGRLQALGRTRQRQDRRERGRPTADGPGRR